MNDWQKEHKLFINSPEWKKIRENLFKLRGKQCEKCGSKKKIQVHHLTYDTFGGGEQPTDLIILCEKHHEEIHGIKRDHTKSFKYSLKTCKKKLIDRYGITKRYNNWRGIAKSLSKKLNDNAVFEKRSEARTYVINIVKDIYIREESNKTTKKEIYKETPQKEIKTKVILRKKVNNP